MLRLIEVLHAIVAFISICLIIYAVVFIIVMLVIK